jgi:hypothetical protein
LPFARRAVFCALLFSFFFSFGGKALHVYNHVEWWARSGLHAEYKFASRRQRRVAV